MVNEVMITINNHTFSDEYLDALRRAVQEPEFLEALRLKLKVRSSREENDPNG
jgi:hypothetical protein